MFVCVCVCVPVGKDKLYNLFVHTGGSLQSSQHFVFIIELVMCHGLCTVSLVINVECVSSVCRYSHVSAETSS